jgi:hypothetical protein
MKAASFTEGDCTALLHYPEEQQCHLHDCNNLSFPLCDDQQKVVWMELNEAISGYVKPVSCTPFRPYSGIQIAEKNHIR